jgi:hypothetical protein
MFTKALVGFVTIAATGCAATTEDAGDSTEAAQTAAAAPFGVAAAPIMGKTNWSDWKFGCDPKNPAAKCAVEVTGVGTNPPGLGPLLPLRDHQTAFAALATGGWPKPVRCLDAERFVKGNATATSNPADLCYVVYSSDGVVDAAGFWGVGVTLYRLDQSGQGLATNYKDPKGLLKPDTTQGATVNRPLDEAKATAAMVALKGKFSGVRDSERNDCLKNPRAVQWLDIQAHYYCMLPKDSVRTCYSEELVKSRAAGSKTPAQDAYTTCFSKAQPGTDAKWVDDNQKATFQTIMFTQQAYKDPAGKVVGMDFNIESENRAIDNFYTAVKAPRPDRLVDSYPRQADQPRYAAIRDIQGKRP